MTDLTPQQEGRAWETEFAASMGGEPIPMSGAGFNKLDVRGFISKVSDLFVLWSLKWAGRKKSFVFKDEYMREALDAIHGPGGIGGSAIPGVAFKTEGDEYVIFRKDDAVLLMSERPGIASSSSGSYASPIDRTPHLLRGD